MQVQGAYREEKSFLVVVADSQWEGEDTEVSAVCAAVPWVVACFLEVGLVAYLDQTVAV